MSSEDTPDILKIRYGKLRKNQRKILDAVNKQGDRGVTVVYDAMGNNGKSWMAIHLFETGRALVVPRASTTAEKLSAYVCSAYEGQEYIIIDIPRSGQIAASIYECIEELKDGLVFDHRYYGKCRNIRGVKVLVTTNQKLEISALSLDRWTTLDPNGEIIPIDTVAKATAAPRKRRNRRHANTDNEG